AKARTWFLREVRAATRLHHPNVALALDANEADGVHFLVLEYVDGQTLEALVRRLGPMPVRLACRGVRQAAAGLHAAHEQSIVHRDVKPSNLLIPRAAELHGPDGWAADASADAGPLVKVVDFGVARFHDPSAGESLGRSTENGFLGTPDYIAPEQ